MKEKLKSLLPHLAVVAAFIVVSILYFYPILEGKSFSQPDNIHAKGMANEITEFEQNNNGEYTAWTNSMFGGMPSYQIKGPDHFRVYSIIARVLRVFLPYENMAIFFVYLLGFYILLCSMKFKRGPAVIGALAFALSSYNIIIIAAGHITKCYAIAYMAPVLAGMLLLYQNKLRSGGFLFAIALGLEISCNHPQILYYLALMCGIFVIYKGVIAIKEKQTKQFLIASAVAAGGLVLAILPNITMLWTTWEYGKYSTRSQSELTSRQNTSGLDKDYAFSWSYGVDETLTLMVPEFKGGASEYFGNDADSQVLSSISDPNVKQFVGSRTHYWGAQPFTSGPVYVGAIICFLFILGLFVVKSSLKWWLLAATVFSFFLSWGANCAFVSDFLFDYLPMFNKFRSVSMGLVIAQVAMPLLALMALKEFSDDPDLLRKSKTDVYISLGMTAGICFMLLLFSPVINVLSPRDVQDLAQYRKTYPESMSIIEQMQNTLITVRLSILRLSLVRSIVFILLSFVVMVLYKSKVLNSKSFFVVMAVLVMADMWYIDYKYLGPKDYKEVSLSDTDFKPGLADQFILKDSDPDFRVLNLERSPFNDGITPYFHKCIGGYHGAKMRRYQEFIDAVLYPAVSSLYNAGEHFEERASSLNALNMLNTKFIIYNSQTMPFINLKSFGNAWFVKKYNLVKSADEELSEIQKVNPLETAVINTNINPEFSKLLPKDQFLVDDSSVINLTSYKPNHLTYECKAYSDRLAVFSEIYYPKGWQAYIDGKPVEHTCADYILRALNIPKGIHKIEFVFDPDSVRVGGIVSAISSSLVLLLLLAFLAWKFFKSKKDNLSLTNTEKID